MKDWFLIIFALALMGAGPAEAQSVYDRGGVISEVRGGIVAQGCCGQAVDKEQGIGVNAEVVFRSPEFLSVILSPRPVIGGTLATDSDATSQLYAGLDWRFDLTEKFYINGGVGGAIHNGETDAFDPVADANRVDNTTFLGCRALFRLSADVGYRVTKRINTSIYWAHLSNAGLCGDNEGLDTLGVRVGWQF